MSPETAPLEPELMVRVLRIAAATEREKPFGRPGVHEANALAFEQIAYELDRLRSENEQLRALLSPPAAAQEPDEIEGCGDHSCVIAKPKGMGTNGGCRCPTFKLRAATLHFRIEREAAAQEIERLRAALVGLRDHDTGCFGEIDQCAGDGSWHTPSCAAARRALTQEARNGQ